MKGLARTIKSFKYAGNGIYLLFSKQHNACIHLIAGILAIVLGFIYRISPPEWTTIVIVIGLVLAAEAFNTALEMLGNRVSPEYDPAMAKIKDMAAGAVLIMAITAFITGLIIFVPKVF